MHIEVSVPDGVSGPWRVESFDISEREAQFANVRAAIRGFRNMAVSPGNYKRLMRGHDVIMSNTDMEVRTHRIFVLKATGSILINGLGLGMALTAILRKPDVTDVTVVELSPDVIKLVGPTFASDPRVTIVEADAKTFVPPCGKVYDCVWHDIWDAIMRSNLKEMAFLHRRYAKRSRWQGSWAQQDCRDLPRHYA